MYSSYTILYCTVLYFCTVFVPPFTTGVLSPFHYFVLYLYKSLYCICTIFISLSCTVFVLPVYLYHYFVLCLYHSLYCVCTVFVSQSTTGVLSPFPGYLSSQGAYQSINQSVGRCRRFLPGWYCSVHSLLLLSAVLFSILPWGS